MGQEKLFAKIDKAVFDYKMICAGDKILVGASGGKDSTALLLYLAQRKAQRRENFDFLALNVQTDIAPKISAEVLRLFDEREIPLKTVEISVIERLKPGEKMNCWWCATQRRTELNNFAMSNGFNKVALGHHLDDILETFLMNALQKGELSTMPPTIRYEKYPVQVIRPLCYAAENEVVEFAQKCGFAQSACTCAYQSNVGRKEAKKRLFALTEGEIAAKKRLFRALRNVKMQYLAYPES